MTTLLRTVRQSQSIYMPVMARITAIRSLTAHERVYTVALPDGMSLDHDPGQFVQLSILGVGEAPISISSSPSRSNGTFELCVRAVGDLTRVLHRLKPGATVGIRGPFGRGFPVERFRGKDALFVIGGLGLAPMRSLIYQLLDQREKYGRVIILYGAREPDELLFKDELMALEARADVELHLTVDCGDETWNGCVGFVNALLKRVPVNAHNTVAVVVGPPVMYRYVINDLCALGVREHDIWLSFERRMKCGVGKCGHCQINDLYACLDGPSLCYADVKALEEAL
jgi:NAD(P)H-flavin reductase